MTSEKTGNKDMDNIIGEILTCEQEIKRARNGLDTRRVGFMRYFWPFLIVSIAIVLNVVINADLADILIWSGLEAEAALRRSYNEFAIVVLIVVIIAGIIIAAHCRNKKNYSLEEDELNKRAVIRKNERKLVELKVKLKELQEKPVCEPSGETSDAAISKPVSMTEDEYNLKKSELRKIEKAIEESTNKLTGIRQKEPLKDHTAMEYFWPFIIASFFAFWQTYFLIVCVFDLVLKAYIDQGIVLLLSSICFTLTHIIGGYFSRKHAREANRGIDKARNDLNMEIKKIRSEITDLEYKRERLLEEIATA